jgi:hypothetical protein
MAIAAIRPPARWRATLAMQKHLAQALRGNGGTAVEEELRRSNVHDFSEKTTDLQFNLLIFPPVLAIFAYRILRSRSSSRRAS